MSDPKQLPLGWFHNLQLEKLSHARNLVKPHWLKLSREQLLERVIDETHELSMAVQFNENDEAMIDECVDVANFAVMLADKIQRKNPPTDGSTVEGSTKGGI